MKEKSPFYLPYLVTLESKKSKDSRFVFLSRDKSFTTIQHRRVPIKFERKTGKERQNIPKDESVGYFYRERYRCGVSL